MKRIDEHGVEIGMKEDFDSSLVKGVHSTGKSMVIMLFEPPGEKQATCLERDILPLCSNKSAFGCVFDRLGPRG